MNMLHIIYRINDKIDAVHGKREFDNKQNTIFKCFPTLISAIKYALIKEYNILLHIVTDDISEITRDFIRNNINLNSYNIVESAKTGNMGSFKTCYDIAIKLKDDDYILFIEDDYLCDIRSIDEIMLFFKMFNPKIDRIFINPTTDMGNDRLVHIGSSGKYDTTTIIPGSRQGIGIFWKLTKHSTSTFAAKVKAIKHYNVVFLKMMAQSELNLYIRNTIFSHSPCFLPLYPLMQHYLKSYTMYWFDDRNTEKEYVYQDNKFKM